MNASTLLETIRKELNDIKSHNEVSLATILKKIEDSGPLNEKIATELSLKIDAVEGMISKLSISAPKPPATKAATSKGDDIEKFARAEFAKNAEAWKTRYNIPAEILTEIKNIEITKKNSSSATKMEAIFTYIYSNISPEIKEKIVEDYKHDKTTSLDVINAPEPEDDVDEASAPVSAPVIVKGKGKGKGKAITAVEINKAVEMPAPVAEDEVDEAPVSMPVVVKGKGKGKGKAITVEAPVAVPEPEPEPEEEEAEDDGIEFVVETPAPVVKAKGKGKGKK